MSKYVSKKKVMSSLIWKLLERFGSQGISFFVSIILTRLILPELYGQIALVTVFVSTSGVLVQTGFNAALIRKKDADDLDFSTVFYVSLSIAVLLYLVLFFVSPFIANFYNEPDLVLTLRILSLTLFFGAVNSVQIAIVSRSFQFKKLFYSNLGSIFVSGIVGIILALKDYGVWALVWQQITNQFLTALIMWFTVKWRPKLVFSFERLKVLFSFGWKILITSLISTLFWDLRSLVIGKGYSTSMLAFYSKGKQFPSLLITNIDSSIQSVMLPAYSSYQDDKNKIKDFVRRSISTSAYILFPMMVGLAVISKSLVKILLTDKWLQSVPFMQLYCVSYMFTPISTGNLQAIKAMGYSGIILKLELIKKSIDLLFLLFCFKYGVYAIAIGHLISNLLSMIINILPNKKLLDYGYKEQFFDFLPSLAIALFMGFVIYNIQLFYLSSYTTLLIQICVGIVIYIILSKTLKIKTFDYLLNILREMFRNWRKAYTNYSS